MKKLLQINLCSNILSTGKITEGIGAAAISKGWSSVIAYGMNRSNPSVSKTIKIGGKHYLFLPYIETLLLDNHAIGLSCRSATLKLIKRIEEIKPDIIQLHTIHCYYLNVKVLFEFLLSKNMPIVWTLHDCWAFTGHCAHFDFVNCSQWKTGCKKCSQTKEYPRSIWRDRCEKNFNEKKKLFTSINNLTIVSVSDWLKKNAEQSFLKKYPMITIPNGVDTDVFKPTPNDDIRKRYNLQNKFLIVGVASSWTKKKGLDDYCKLAELLNDSEQLLLVGVDEEQARQLPYNIITLKKTFDIKELVRIYSACDVLLNLSYEETFGMTTIEAFACGTPAIVYNKTASPELVTPETGFVVNAGDISELMTSIKTLQAKGKSYYSRACIERVSQYYSSNKCFERYIDLYEELLINNNVS